jgi:hypothetical protein
VGDKTLTIIRRLGAFDKFECNWTLGNTQLLGNWVTIKAGSDWGALRKWRNKMSRAATETCRLRRLGKPFRLCGAMTLACSLCLGLVSAASGQASRHGKTGREFERIWAANVPNIVWSDGTPVRQAIDSLARTQGVAIMLDRRIDPGTAIELSLQDVSMLEVLQGLAAQCDATPVVLNDIVYVGPRLAVGGLTAVAESRRRDAGLLPRAVSIRLLAAREWDWDELAEPRALVQKLADEARVRIDNPEMIPHDLWPAQRLPALPWVDRLTLVLTGFGLTYAIEDDGRRVRFMPLPEAEIVERTYATTLSAAQLESVLAVAPPGVIGVQDGRLEVRGTAEEHNQLQRLLAGRAKAARSGPQRKSAADRAVDKTLFTLKVTSQPVEAILRAVESQSGIHVQWDDASREQLQTLVSFDVREVKLEALLDAALKPARLTFRREGESIRIVPEQ